MSAVILATFVVTIALLFILAIHSHHTTLRAEIPLKVTDSKSEVKKGRFLKVSIFVNITAYIPLIVAAMAITDAQAPIKLGIIGKQFPNTISLWIIAVIFGLITLLVYVALSPFIPRTLTDFKQPFFQQMKDNLANWKRAVIYIAVPYILLCLFAYFLTKGNLQLFELFSELFSNYSRNGLLYIVLILIALAFEGVVTGLSVVMFATAFSMHFVDTLDHRLD